MSDTRKDPSSRLQLIELGVFLFLVLPSMVLSFFAFKTGPGPPFALIALASMFQQTALLCLVLYFAWRNGEAFADFGWRRRRLGREMLLGAALYFPVAVSLALLQSALKHLGLRTLDKIPEFLTPSGAGEILLAVLLFAVVAVAEEGVFRGYLIRRLRNLTGRPAAAVAGAAAVFCLGHGYQNPGGVAATFFLGAVFGAVYLWRGSLAAPIVIHFLQNLLTVMAAVAR